MRKICNSYVDMPMVVPIPVNQATMAHKYHSLATKSRIAQVYHDA